MRKSIGIAIMFLTCLLCGCLSTSGEGTDTIESKQSAKVEQKKKEQKKKEPEVYVEMTFDFGNMDESEAAWLVPAISEKLEINLSKYTDYGFLNKTNINDIINIQKETESGLYDENSAVELGMFKVATHQLFTTIRDTEEGYSLSATFTDMKTRENKAIAISTPKSSVTGLYSSTGSAANEVSISLCEQLGFTIPEVEKNYLMQGEDKMLVEDRQTIYDREVRENNNLIAELDAEISSLSTSTDLDSSIKQEKLKAEKALAEEKLKLAQENQRRAAEEIKQRKADDLKNAERTVEQQNRIASMSKELNDKVQSVRNAKFDNESLIGQIQVLELKKKAIVDIHNSIMSERESIFNETLKKILDKKEEINNRPYRSAELLADGKTPSDFALEQRENIYNKEKANFIALGQSDIDLVTGKLGSQKDILLKEVNNDYTKLKPRKSSTLGNELVVTYGAYDGDRQGWELYVTVKSDNIIIFQTKSFLKFELLTGKDPVQYAADDYYGYLDDVDFYDSLFLRGEPILIFELEYSAKPEDVTKPSQYNFNFYNFKCYDTQSLMVNGNNLRSSKTNNLTLDEKSIVRQMSPVRDLQPALEELPTLEEIVEAELERLWFENEMKMAGIITDLRRLPSRTDGSYGTQGTYVEFGNWPQTVKADDVTINTSETLVINGRVCYKGSDNCYYAVAKAEPYHDDNVFDNGVSIEEGKEYYFKLEPIKWRVVTDDYQGGKLLVAENILFNILYDTHANWYNSLARHVNGERVDAINYKYSTVRACLNGLNGSYYDVEDYTGKGFINSAFTKEAIESINTVTVDNSLKSTGRSYSRYACENTEDKIFLLSGEEVTRSSYGFDSDEGVEDTARRRKTTDYSRATGTDFKKDGNYKNNGWWWLRSPDYDDNDNARLVSTSGYAGGDISVLSEEVGVVPALSISF